MTRSRVPRSAALAAIAVAAMALAGCGDGTGTESTSTTFTPSTSTTPTTDGPTLNTLTPPLRRFVYLNETPPDRTVRFYQTKAQSDELFEGCDPGENKMGTEFFWMGVWNRTGQVLYEQHRAWPVSKYGTIDHSIQLPNDPPYLIWAGATCSGRVTIELHGKGKVLPSSLGKDEPNGIDDDGKQYVTVDIPAGATEADGFFTVGGRTYMVELQPASASWERGSSPFGELFIYAPDQAPGGDWVLRNYWHVTEDGWEQGHKEAGMPGRYRYHAKLDAPALQATTWRGHLWTYEFQEPELARLGFQVPFRSYLRA